MANGGTSKDTVAKLAQFVIHINEQATSQEKIDAILAENDISEAAIEEKALAFERYLDDTIAGYHSHLAADRESLSARIQAAVKEIISKSALGSADFKSIGLPPQLVAAFHRNLAGLTQKDKDSMREDMELLKILEDHINKNK